MKWMFRLARKWKFAVGQTASRVDDQIQCGGMIYTQILRQIGAK